MNAPPQALDAAHLATNPLGIGSAVRQSRRIQSGYHIVVRHSPATA